MNGRILVMCATRNRPSELNDMCQSVRQTSDCADIVAYVDEDQADLYRDAQCRIVVGPRVGMCESLTHLCATHPGYDVYGMATDDCIFRTRAWDEGVLNWAGANPVLAIGPFTERACRMDFVWLTAGWIERAGAFCPIATRHYYWDVALQIAAEQAGCFKPCNRTEFFIDHLNMPVLNEGDEYGMWRHADHVESDAVTAMVWLAHSKQSLVSKLTWPIRVPA